MNRIPNLQVLARPFFRQLANGLRAVQLLALVVTMAFPLHGALAGGPEDAQAVINRATQHQASVQDISAAAKDLGNHPYNEVAQTLLDLIEGQIARGERSEGLNTYILNSAMESFAKIGTREFAGRIKGLQQRLVQLAVTPRFTQQTKQFVERLMDQAVSDSSNNTKKLPSLNVAPPTAPTAPAPTKEPGFFEKVKGMFDGKESAPPPAAPATAIVPTTAPAVVKPTNLDNATLFRDELTLLARPPNLSQNALTLLKSTVSFISDGVITASKKNEEFKIAGRDAEAKEVLQTLVRIKGANPMLVGPAGAGKTTVAQRVAQVILSELPQNGLYNELKGAVVIETSPARLSRLAKSNDSNSQADAVEMFIEAVLDIEAQLKKPIIVFMDEIHTLSKAQVEALKPFMESKDRMIRLVGASTGQEFNNAFRHNAAFMRRVNQITVQEFSVERTIEIVRQTWQPMVEKKYDVKFDDSAVKLIVETSTTLKPDNGRFDASIKVMQDMSISMVDKLTQRNGTLQITEKSVNLYLQKELGYPVNPKDPKAMREYQANLEKAINQDVMFQDRAVRATTGLWMQLMGDRQRGVRVQALLGPTGTGKSELGRAFAKHALGTDAAFFELDANTFKTGGHSLNSLLGAPNGIISSDRTAGSLMEFLDDAARGKFHGVILINEAERMPADAWERIMEMLDTGQITGGDGKVRTLRRHMIMLTSNRTDKIIFPKGIERLSHREMDTHLDSYDADKLKTTYQQRSSGNDEFVLPDPIIARVDSWSLFRPITEEIAIQIATRFAERQKDRLEKYYDIHIELDPAAIYQMARSSFKYGMGARPVIRSVQTQFDEIVRSALSVHDTVNSGMRVRVTAGKDHLIGQASPDGKTWGMEVAQALPKSSPENPLNDPELAKKMLALETVLKERVIGQDEAMKSIAEAIMAHQGNPKKGKKPARLFLVGSTGTGKTSTAKALAYALYGNEDRAELIDLGKVNFEGALNNIMGSPRGYAGNDKDVLFEEILRRNPNGGVIVFDEASNMGGGDMSIKEALFKNGFYSLLDEGKWRSNSTGEEYDLSKYTFIFTGNDGEKLFHGMSADDQRMAKYQRSKSKSFVHNLLTSAGVPEAFLGRIPDVILMKPLLSNEVARITARMVKEAMKPYEEMGLRFNVSPDFYDKVSRAFFSHDKGARAIEGMLETKLISIISRMIFLHGGISGLNDHTFTLDLKDTLGGRPYATTRAGDRKVVLSLEVQNPAKRVVGGMETDLSNDAVLVNKQNFRDARATAVHEAGHAVTNDPRKTGYRLAHLTIVGADKYLGYARYDEAPTSSKNFTMETLISHVAKMVGGMRAQKMDGQPLDAGWSQDRQNALDLISKSIFEFGLIPELHGVVMRDGKPHLTGAQNVIAAAKVKEILALGEQRADAILKANWGLIRTVSAHLLKKGSMTGEEFEAMRRSTQQVTAPNGQAKGYRLRCETILH